jgi:hypothetical protein
MFSVGISTAFALVNRLDRLMVAVKEVVGEHYHIHGVGVVSVPGVVDGDLSVREHGGAGYPQTSGGGYYPGRYPENTHNMDREHNYDGEKEKRGLGVHFDDARV